MSDEIRRKLGLFSLSCALILTANAIGHEVGHLNWSGLLSYLGGFAAGGATFYRKRTVET